LDVGNTFANNGVPIEIISIGNEITTGLLWPLGKTNNFYNIARLLHSASAGIKDSRLNPKPKIMIHLDNGWNWETQKWWYNSVLSQGPLLSSDYDIMGVSYYPFYNPSATLGNLRWSLQQMAATWGKSIIVAETDWPANCPSPAYAFPSDTTWIPKNIAGQTTWMQEVAKIVAATNRGIGLFYWEPAWIRNAGLGSSCWDNLMVDQNGKARASLNVFNSI
jgi:arabinogalactan endo-1,4-beta-galactosidase